MALTQDEIAKRRANIQARKKTPVAQSSNIVANTNKSAFQQQKTPDVPMIAPESGSTIDQQRQFSENVSNTFGAPSGVPDSNVSASEQQRRNQAIDANIGVGQNAFGSVTFGRDIDAVPEGSDIFRETTFMNKDQVNATKQSVEDQRKAKSLQQYLVNLDVGRVDKNRNSFGEGGFMSRENIASAASILSRQDPNSIKAQTYNLALQEGLSLEDAEAFVRQSPDTFLSTEEQSSFANSLGQAETNLRGQGTGAFIDETVTPKEMADNPMNEFNIQYQENLLNLEQDRDKAIEDEIKLKQSRINVSSKAARDKIFASIEENVRNKYNERFDDVKKDLDQGLERSKRSFVANEENARIQTAEKARKEAEMTPAKRKAAEFEAFVEQERALDPTLKREYLENKWSSINKYESGSNKAKEIGATVDAVIQGGFLNADGFAEIVRSTEGDIDEAYKGLKSRVGSAKADQIKQEHLSSMGYDEETIKTDKRSTVAGELYRGEEKSVVALAQFVKDAEALGLPDELIQSELEQIAESPLADFTVKASADFYAKSLAGDTEDRDIRTIDGALIEITPEGVKELYKSGGSVDESKLFENADRNEQRQVTQIMRQLPTKLKDSPLEKAARENEILADLREGRNVQDILDELNGFLILDDKDLNFATAMRVLATGSDASLSDVSAAINRGDKLQPILTVENAKMEQYNDDDFNQAAVANIVQEQNELLGLIESVGQGFMGAVDSRLFSADAIIRNRAIKDAGIKEGDEAFAAAASLGAKMARIMAEDRKNFGGTALTDTEAKFLAPMIAEMKDQPASAAVKISEMANFSLQKHNFYRQKEGLPVFTSVNQILDDEAKIDLYQEYAEQKFSKSSPAETGQTNTGIQGTVTGYGSKFWDKGLDVAVSGGFDAPIPATISGEVIEVVNNYQGDPKAPLKDGKSQNKGWGNQVKVRDADGNEHWFSHLSGTDLQVGQSIAEGDVIGRQGNTGRTYSLSGGSGTHLDYTVRKPDGSYLTPQEVEKIARINV